MFRKLIKFIFSILLDLIVLPFALCFTIISKIPFVEYKSISIVVSIVPTIIGDKHRRLFYKFTLKKLGDKFNIYWLSYIVYPGIEIGSNVTIEEKCVISSCVIGDNVILVANVSIMSGKNHHFVNDISKTFYESPGKFKTIKLVYNLWIGTHAVIMGDVNSGTVVGAGSVVMKMFEKNAIIGGAPAKLIRIRGN